MEVRERGVLKSLGGEFHVKRWKRGALKTTAWASDLGGDAVTKTDLGRKIRHTSPVKPSLTSPDSADSSCFVFYILALDGSSGLVLI